MSEDTHRRDEPVAWTMPDLLDRLKDHPREGASMWGEPNGRINVPLFTRALVPDPPAVLVEALEATLAALIGAPDLDAYQSAVRAARQALSIQERGETK